jgi:oligopeptidase B
MKQLLLPQTASIVLACCITFACSNSTEMSTSTTPAPIAKKVPHELEKHGDVRVDDYYWLNDREDQEVIDYLHAENDYTKEQLASTEAFQESLFNEMKARIKEDDESVPYKYRGYWYSTKYEPGKEYPQFYRKLDEKDASEELMVDQNQLAEGHSFHAIGGLGVSPDNQLLALGEDTVSRRIYTIRFKNLETGEFLEDILENTTGGVAWANDNKTMFYSQKDETLRSYKIFRHILGTPQSEDVEIFHEDDETFYTGVTRSKSGDYIMIYSGSTVSTEYQLIDANNPLGEFKVFFPRERDHEYSIAHYQDHFYILTNWEAKNFRLMKAPVNNTDRSNWEEVIAHREDVLLEDIDLFKNYLVLSDRSEGLSKLRVRTWDGQNDYYIPFNDPAYVSYTSINREYDTDILRYGYASMTTPFTTYNFNMTDKTQEVLKQQEVVGGHNPADYVSERIFVKAQDGAMIPMSLVYKKGLERNGKNPTLLYGYGSYGAVIDPSFSTTRLSLLNRGFVFAIAHIRGSETMGRSWYEDGKLLNKMNTFTDFIDCSKALVEEQLTSPDHLYAMGGSAGGLLMGAVINLEPELFNGVVAAVPFVDVVTTMLDESIPLTTGEYDEWGNPNDKVYYDYMKSYSPYDNVIPQNYPNLLVTTGLHDSQVQYWEPAKWVAKLRDVKTGDNLLLLHTNMEAGHGGASGRFASLKETAMEYAFIMHLEGINE